MGPRWIRSTALLLWAWVVGSMIAGCGKPTKPNPEAVNDAKPTANARIMSQTTFGSADLYTTVYAMRRADDGSFAFRGLYNSASGVGVLNANGSLRWFQQVIYEPDETRALPGTAIVPHGLVVTGRRDSDGDGQYDVGYAALYSSAGSLLNQILVTSDTSEVSLVGFVPVGDSTFVACGGEWRAGTEHPLLALLHLKAPGILELGKTVILRSLIGRFGRVVTLPSVPADLAIAATFLKGTSRSLYGLRAPWPGFDPIAVEWSHEIVSTVGPWVTLPGLEQAGGNLYLAGTVNDSRKPSSSAGRPRDSGLAASYSSTGNLRWLSIVSLTQHSERFYGIAVGEHAVYAVGHGSEYAEASNGFGYGLISQLDLNTGQVVENYMLGDDHYLSGFYAATWTASGLICGGLTKLEFTNGVPIPPGTLPGPNHSRHQGWLATVNVSDPLATTTMPSRRQSVGRRGYNSARLDRIPGVHGNWVPAAGREHEHQVVPREDDPADGDRNQHEEHDQRIPGARADTQDGHPFAPSTPPPEHASAGEDLGASHDSSQW